MIEEGVVAVRTVHTELNQHIHDDVSIWLYFTLSREIFCVAHTGSFPKLDQTLFFSRDQTGESRLELFW